MKTELMSVPHYLKAYDHFFSPDSNAGKIAVYQ